MKKKLLYIDQVSFLAVSGTLDKLRAIAYYQGDKGKLGTAARDLLGLGLDVFLKGLTPTERKRFNEILASVKVASTMRADNHPLRSGEG